MKTILTAALGICLILAGNAALAVEPARPNVLWLTSEDNGPHLGCYGDDFADTPRLDRLAGKGMLYSTCWSNAPVCAPARTCLISGMYPPSTGSQHMRSITRLPDGMKMYPQYLREAGYYCTNNSKEDYNLEKPGQVWDASSRKAHWKNRKPGQPFFAVFNYTVSHESQIRKRPHKQVHDPAKVRVPAYHPDTPEVRQDWAQYYDKLTEMDAQIGNRLKELEKAGLADDTIIFYYGDHGSGMPRSKRWPFDSGLRVPLIVYFPEKYKNLRPDDYLAGGKSDRLVSFVDFAPTLLSICGIKPPKHFQGHAFAGPYAAKPQPYIYGFRGRMDERYDMVRSVRDKRYVYIRNYMPHKLYGQHVSYMFQTPTTRVWKRLFDEGKLNEAQSHFWKTKPAEELYDLKEDPDEVHNLAGSPKHREILLRMRKAQWELAVNIRDLGFLPEGEIHARAVGSTPYEVGHDRSKYSLEQVMAAADTATRPDERRLSSVLTLLNDSNRDIRHWGALGILIRGKDGADASKKELHKALADASPYVRIVAAEALARYGSKKDLDAALAVLIDAADLNTSSVFPAMYALNVIDILDKKAALLTDSIRKLPRTKPGMVKRTSGYVGRLLDKTLSDLQ